MNTKPITTLLSIIALSSCVWSCNDKESDPDPIPSPPVTEEQLPPITTTGAGTFGCKVNGKVWVAKSNKTGWPPTYASINKAAQYLTNISGSIINGNTSFLIINVLFKDMGKSEYSIGYNIDNDPKGQLLDVVANMQWLTDSLLGGG